MNDEKQPLYLNLLNCPHMGEWCAQVGCRYDAHIESVNISTDIDPKLKENIIYEFKIDAVKSGCLKAIVL